MVNSGHILSHYITTPVVSKILFTTASQTHMLKIFNKDVFPNYKVFLPETNFPHLMQIFFPLFATKRHYS